MALRENAARDRLLCPVGFVFLECVKIVESPDEEEVGNLLDDFERIGNAACPKGIPDLIDLTADFTGEHAGWFYPANSGKATGKIACEKVFPSEHCSCSRSVQSGSAFSGTALRGNKPDVI